MLLSVSYVPTRLLVMTIATPQYLCHRVAEAQLIQQIVTLQHERHFHHLIPDQVERQQNPHSSCLTSSDNLLLSAQRLPHMKYFVYLYHSSISDQCLYTELISCPFHFFLACDEILSMINSSCLSIPRIISY